MTTQCCICHRVKAASGWVEDVACEARDARTITHSYCPECLAAQMKEIEMTFLRMHPAGRPAAPRPAAGSENARETARDPNTAGTMA